LAEDNTAGAAGDVRRIDRRWSTIVRLTGSGLFLESCLTKSVTPCRSGVVC